MSNYKSPRLCPKCHRQFRQKGTYINHLEDELKFPSGIPEKPIDSTSNIPRETVNFKDVICECSDHIFIVGQTVRVSVYEKYQGTGEIIQWNRRKNNINEDCLKVRLIGRKSDSIYNKDFIHLVSCPKFEVNSTISKGEEK